MSDAPWLTIIGLGEDGPDGLCAASLAALNTAEIVMGPARHVALLPPLEADVRIWPVPFADGLRDLMALRGRPVVALASGDPFWFGAGAVLARGLEPGEWRAFPGRSTFSLVAARMGWGLEATRCFGLHAAPLSRLRPALAPRQRMIVLVRDGAAVPQLAGYLRETGFGATGMTVFEAVGGPRETRKELRADAPPGATAFTHPVCVALEVAGDGAVLPCATGRDDAWFAHDGQITKRLVRAATLSTLAPRPFEHLWDIGGGSGSIGIEWLLSDPTVEATAIEADATRAARIAENAARLGVDRLAVVTGAAPDALAGVQRPDVVFVGGGLDAALLGWLEARLAPGTRLVANAVTLETVSLLVASHARLGGQLTRLAVSEAAPIGPKRGWKAGFPIVQWSTVL
ncbi:precorrin-6y C5,15-methyltransferase (decarboxylating) subunit CbiE [Cognatishimia sp. F0-27]|uniref:precorrin-6y C5,15-methyltransferase (decarboxylating) subunit CbiE n=1 Tax=Cognatishimia sp. F0-27 TaxID=2816855 RepID=UPI001D0C1424|nr:precorrin-6y C5,15-methyltransferase (decarboxylating) subunit CbiE [Cognatishimia sp. F0-27]MCC1494733.1 precorrin-6y C5,15-methyltransferase (decarboxylating) subunit CbiE [Cognatishimia sp. F0-27]